MPFPVWLLVALAFLYFSFIFWQYSNMPIRNFVFRRQEANPLGEGEEGEKENEIQTLTTESVLEFEGYLKSINNMIKTRFRIGAIGFLIAAMGAFVAMFI
jgi:hypothetical protein